MSYTENETRSFHSGSLTNTSDFVVFLALSYSLSFVCSICITDAGNPLPELLQTPCTIILLFQSTNDARRNLEEINKLSM